MSETPNLKIGYMSDGQAGAYLVINDALNRIDALLHLSVKDRNLTAPPGGESNGECYLVASPATDEWEGHEGDIAAYYDGWIFMTPKEGFNMWVADEDVRLDFYDSSWHSWASWASYA